MSKINFKVFVKFDTVKANKSVKKINTSNNNLLIIPAIVILSTKYI